MPNKLTVPKIEPEFIDLIVAAAKTTFEIQANTPIQTEPLFIKKDKTLASDTRIAGIINLTCEQFKGSLVLCFSEPTFLYIYEAMVDEKIEKIDKDVADCAGEILNIILGTAKTTLQEKGYTLERAIPTVMVGEKLQVQFRSPYPAIVIPFKVKTGRITLEILIEHGA